MASLLAISLSIVALAILLRVYLGRGRTATRQLRFYLLGLALVGLVGLLAMAALDRIGLTRMKQATSADSPLDGPDRAGGDPSGAALVARQSVRYPRPGVQNTAEWQQWQQRLREYLVDEVYGLDFSQAVTQAPQFRAGKTLRSGDLLRSELAISAIDGDSIDAFLLSPADAQTPLPAILVLHGHVKDGDSGLEQTVLPIESYHHSAALKLAQAGFVTLSIELRGFGRRGPPEYPDHRIVAYNALLAGSFYKKLVFEDVKRAIDYLQTRAGVDAQRIGIAGVSLGGELAVEYAALDPRIKAISFHSHGGQTGPYEGKSRPGTPQPHYCHLIPGVSRIMQQEDPFLLLAPRPTQGVRGERQPFADPRFLPELRQAWQLAGRPDALDLRLGRLEEVYRGHGFFASEAREFFLTHL